MLAKPPETRKVGGSTPAPDHDLRASKHRAYLRKHAGWLGNGLLEVWTTRGPRGLSQTSACADPTSGAPGAADRSLPRSQWGCARDGDGPGDCGPPACDPLLPVSHQPGMHALAADPIPFGELGHRKPGDRGPATILTARSRSSTACGFLDTMSPYLPRGHSLQGTRGGPPFLLARTFGKLKKRMQKWGDRHDAHPSSIHRRHRGSGSGS
jgi:hypothetical protein